jgi:uncharacterized protein (TIRG00374 family)
MILPKIDMFIDGFQVLKDWKQIFSILFWIVVSWILWTLIIAYGIKTVHPEAKIWWPIFTQGVLALGIALPSAPAGLGVFEGAIVAALSFFEISREQALSIAVVVHLFQIITTAIIGLIAVMRQGQSVSDILSKIRAERIRE